MPAEEFSLANSKAFAGQELGVSGWITINQQRIDQFAECTEDHQWIHVDVERAKRDSPLGTTIAHGYLMLAPSKFQVVVKPAGISQALNYESAPRVRAWRLRT